MLQLSTNEIDAAINSFLDDCSNMNDLLSFSLGPTSPVATAHLYYSSVDKRGQTVYSMVSERATLLAVDRHGPNEIKELYKQAATLKNPAFLGWVIEADLFERCKTGCLKLRRKGEEEDVYIEVQHGAAVEFDHGHLWALFEKGDHTKVSEEMNKLVPGKDETRTFKPTSWNQGGYDVVFIEVNRDDPNHVVIRFGQVTKSDSHSLKLKYFDNFLALLIAVGYVVDSVELAFIVPLSKIDTFCITGSQVEGSGLLNGHTRYGTAPTRDSSQMQKNCWTKIKERDQIQIYGLDIKSMSYPGAI